ncbi:hypothetical protein [Sphingobium sp.]|uniref:hypothetical protein n=1 Tax=Sphingobium sp. TaxID=1912891 RepID=UPI0028BDE326|nr:hypothetical protein [Sphingobium sp.]
MTAAAEKEGWMTIKSFLRAAGTGALPLSIRHVDRCQTAERQWRFAADDLSSGQDLESAILTGRARS